MTAEALTKAQQEAIIRDALLDDNLAAQYLNMSPGYIRTLRSKGEGPKYYKIGKSIRFRKEDLDKWVFEHKCDPAA